MGFNSGLKGLNISPKPKSLKYNQQDATFSRSIHF